MPPYVVWKPTSLDYLEWARDQVGDDAFLFEPRHQSWFAEDVRAELLRFLEERKMTWVVVDAPRSRRGRTSRTRSSRRRRRSRTSASTVATPGRGTCAAAAAAQRFDYLYGEDELREWVPPLRELSNEADEAYAFFNNNNQTNGVAQAPAGAFLLAQAPGRGEGADRLMRILAVTHSPDAALSCSRRSSRRPGTSSSSGTSASRARRRTAPTR